jgi:tetratricopeptide (TPR) repeat protein
VLWRKRPFDRTELLAAADRARARGRTRKAIAGYQKVLETVPGDLAVHAKVAPLLARNDQREAALASFRFAAEGQVKAGFPDRGLSLTRQAAGFFPEEVRLWEEIARLHLARARRADAVAALVEGGGRLHRLRSLAAAGQVLRRAVEIEPWHPDATLLLARVLARNGRRDEALSLLEGMEGRAAGRQLRRTRGIAFGIAPSPARLWRWAKAALGRR